MIGFRFGMDCFDDAFLMKMVKQDSQNSKFFCEKDLSVFKKLITDAPKDGPLKVKKKAEFSN